MNMNRIKKRCLLAVLIIIMVTCLVAIAFLAKAESAWTLVAYLLGIFTAVGATFISIIK